MLRVLRYFLLTVQFLVSSVIGLIIGLLRPFNPTNSRWCALTYSRLGLPVIGMKVKIKNDENFPKDRPFIIVANHQSNWDLYIIAASIPNRTVSIGKKSLKWVPLFGQLYWLAGNILIDRSNAKKAMEAMDITKKALMEKSTSIWFFPEGTRNHGNNMQPFKKGAFITAINAGVPIVPVCCSSYLDNFDLNEWNNGVATIEILPPIETDKMNIDDAQVLMDQCHRDMTDCIRKLDSYEKSTPLVAT